jgi:hypothetical protein
MVMVDAVTWKVEVAEVPRPAAVVMTWQARDVVVMTWRVEVRQDEAAGQVGGVVNMGKSSGRGGAAPARTARMTGG